MASAVTINEPFLLSNYSSTRRSAKANHESKNKKRQTGAYASYQKYSSSSDGFVSVAAQSDGVHVLDVATLHPIISHTLGPSTAFTCAPLSQHQPSKNTHTTYAVIASSPDIGAEDQDKTIWKWTENLSSSLTDRPSTSSRNQHDTAVTPHPIFGLYDCDELPERLLAISPTGDISLFTVDLELKATHSASAKENEVLSVHVFSQGSCSFLGSGSKGAVAVLVVGHGDSIQVEAYTIDEAGLINLVITQKVPLPYQKYQEVVATSCSFSGSLNVISSTGLWHTFSLTSSSLSLVSPPVQLKGLSFITSLPPAPPLKKTPTHLNGTDKPPDSPTPSLLALTSSHVLLAGLTPNNEIALLLWDTQYTVLLASHLLPLPSSHSAQHPSLTLSLLSPSASGTKPGNQQAILVISQPSSEGDTKTPIKSSIYVVPYTVPARSTLANALVHANTSKRWLADGPAGGVEQEKQSPQEMAKTKLLASMKVAVEQNRPQAANTLFMEWEKKEQEVLDGKSSISVHYGYSFVKDILETVVQPQKPPNPLYSSEIVRHLVEKGLVNSTMLEGGILASLRARNDWQSIDLVLRHVPDLSENELIETLNVITAQLPHTNSDAMQVDSGFNQPPTVPDFLATLLKHRQFVGSQLVLAFRRHLRAPETLTIIVQILDDWIKKIQSHEVKILPSKKDLARNEHGALVVSEELAKPKVVQDLPSVDKILDFVQSLLDASFLILLQHPPAHQILSNLRSRIEQEITAFLQIDKLRVPTEGFARAHAKVVEEAEARATKDHKGVDTGEKEEPKKDWRQRRKEAHEKAGMIGVYQLEELVL